MNVITHNEEKTIGIITDPEELTTIGYFTPELLKEWAQMIIDNLGEGTPDRPGVHLHYRINNYGLIYALYAGEKSDNMYVMLAGRDEQ